jgi:hypothetical protein
MTFGTFAPIANSKSDNKVFGGRDNNQVGDVFMGLFAGARQSKGGKDIYVFIDEVDGVETIIFGCHSIQQGLVESGAKVGSRVAIQLAGRFLSSAKAKCGAGKTVVQYQVQVDPNYSPNEAAQQAIAAIMGGVAAAPKPKPSFGSFSAAPATAKKSSPF